MCDLPTPEIVSCETVSLCIDNQFLPELGALNLDWNGWQGARQQRVWKMPLGLTLSGPVPTRFGIRLIRVDHDRYTLHLVWNRTGLAWSDLTRYEVTSTSLPDLLDSLGTTLDTLLSQPIQPETSSASVALSCDQALLPSG
jgi:hypothetical protein